MWVGRVGRRPPSHETPRVSPVNTHNNKQNLQVHDLELRIMNEQNNTQSTNNNNNAELSEVLLPKENPSAVALSANADSSSIAPLAKAEPSSQELLPEKPHLSLIAAPVSDSQAAALVDAKPVPLNSQLSTINSQLPQT